MTWNMGIQGYIGISQGFPKLRVGPVSSMVPPPHGGFRLGNCGRRKISPLPSFGVVRGLGLEAPPLALWRLGFRVEGLVAIF